LQVVPRVNTPVTASDAKSAVESAYRSELGRDPELTQELPLLMALVWIETARGRSVQNNSPGNISASDSYQGKAWRPTWFEVDDSSSDRDKQLHQAMLENRAPSAFRAYDSLAEGAADFIRQLSHTFPEVLDAAAEGDPTGFRDALAQHYSKDYKNTPPGNFESLAKEFGFDPRVIGPRHGVTRVLAIAGFAGILAYGAKSLFRSSRVSPVSMYGGNARKRA
jgi:hypothetical protein